MAEPALIQAVPTPPLAPVAPVADAREAFLSDEPVRGGVVRQAILASWERSRQLQVQPDNLNLSLESDDYRTSPLLRVARPIIDDVADLMATEPMCVILCDDQGVVLERRTGDSSLQQHLDGVWLAPGFSYAERFVGTNGIGTALESRGPAHVFGHEHWFDKLEQLACAGAPIRHPVTGRIAGVLDLTGWRRHADQLMIATASLIAVRIEEGLREQASRVQQALLQDYLAACRRNRGAVLAIGHDLVMMNDRARELLDPADQGPIVAAGTEAFETGQRVHLVLDLPSGATARVHCRPTSPQAHGAGVLLVTLATRQAGPPRPRRPAPASLPTAVGSGPLWAMCRQAVDRHFRSGEWVVLSGEPGTGKRTLARATHQLRTPAAHLRQLDARDFGPSWLDDLADELENGGTVILAHVDELPPPAAEGLADLLEPHRESTDPGRPWVAATTGPRQADVEPDGLLAFFPRTVEVPPLRHHLEDVADLVRTFLDRLTHGDLTCSPEAMRVLVRHRWPGNADQLYGVLRKVVAKRRTGVIEAADLPAEICVNLGRLLSPLEAIECDAIVNALRETGDNKTQAAKLLGMSRATMYRKVREYAITMPDAEGRSSSD